MALIPTTDHLAVVAAGTAHEFDEIAIGQGNRAVPADITNGWNVTALLTPFAPPRSKSNPPGGVSGNALVVDWQDGIEGDNVTYAANEVGLFATPSGGAQYLAAYESADMGAVFTKTAGSLHLRRFRLLLTAAQLVNATFNVTITAPAAPQGSEAAAGLLELADNSEVDAAEANAPADKVPSVAKLWRWFTGARIVARIAALAGANRLSYNALKDTPDLTIYAPLASPGLTGNPTGPTQAAGNDSTRLANTAFTQDAIDRRQLVVTADPTQANINAIPNGGMILVRSTTAYTP